MKKDSISVPLVSVCVPLYNHSDYFAECVESIIAQTYQNIELIVIDDGSSDSSYEVACRYKDVCEQRFVRFKLITRKNKGLCKTLNEALAWCNGDYFSPVASDDIWYPEKIEKQIQFLLEYKNDKKSIGALFGYADRIDRAGQVFVPAKRKLDASVAYDFDDIFWGRAFLSAPTAIINMKMIDAVGGYCEETIIEDFYMWAAGAALGYLLVVDGQVLAKYRVHGDNSSVDISRMTKEKEKLLKRFELNPGDASEAMIARKKQDLIYYAINKKIMILRFALDEGRGFFCLLSFRFFVVFLVPNAIYFRVIKIWRGWRNSSGVNIF